MTENKESNLFMDKIKLSFLVLKKESDLIEVYSNLIKQMRKEVIDVDSLESSDLYSGSWNLAHELYSFLRYNKIKDILEGKRTTKEIKDKIEKLIETMDKYANMTKELKFEELQEIIPILNEVASISGYHNDKLNKSGGSLDDEEY